jgi:hypothetical protein
MHQTTVSKRIILIAAFACGYVIILFVTKVAVLYCVGSNNILFIENDCPEVPRLYKGLSYIVLRILLTG